MGDGVVVRIKGKSVGERCSSESGGRCVKGIALCTLFIASEIAADQRKYGHAAYSIL